MSYWFHLKIAKLMRFFARFLPASSGVQLDIISIVSVPRKNVGRANVAHQAPKERIHEHFKDLIHFAKLNIGEVSFLRKCN